MGFDTELDKFMISHNNYPLSMGHILFYVMCDLRLEKQLSVGHC
jgi:hypothetical protein